MTSAPPATPVTAPEWRVLHGGGAGRLLLGESPVWCAEQQTLHFVDIDGKALHRLQLRSGAAASLTAQKHECVPLPWLVGSVGLVAGLPSCVWLATSSGVHLFDWRSLRSTLLLDLAAAADRPDTRFNDAKVSPQGDLLAGTLVTESNAAKRRGRGHLLMLSAQRYAGGRFGALNRLEVVGAQPLVSGATLSNGLDFAAAPCSRLYWIDTAAKRVDQLELHGSLVSHGAVASSHQQATVHGAVGNWLHPETGQPLRGDPDGMALDADGCLWVALNGGGAVVRLDASSARVLKVITFPVSKVSSLCFGGPHTRSLLVTSVSKGVDLAKEPLAGALFIVDDVGVQGRPSNKLKGNFACDERAPARLLQHKLAQPAAPRSKL